MGYVLYEHNLSKGEHVYENGLLLKVLKMWTKDKVAEQIILAYAPNALPSGHSMLCGRPGHLREVNLVGLGDIERDRKVPTSDLADGGSFRGSADRLQLPLSRLSRAKIPWRS